MRRVKKSSAVPLKLQIISATLGINQFLCTYAAITGGVYLKSIFRTSGSEVMGHMNARYRLAPAADSLKTALKTVFVTAFIH